MDKPDLSGAYALSGPDSVRALYADWADSYDEDFAQGMDYRLPAETAAAFLRAGPPEGALLDVGAGTGLLAAALRGLGHQGPIDAMDLSDAMLARARRKGIYRNLIAADVTKPLPCGGYAGITSSGTFTHGHVGPEALGPMLDALIPGAIVAISVNQGIWDSLGFAEAFATLGNRITGLDQREVAIYGQAALSRDPSHAADRALIVTFRKT